MKKILALLFASLMILSLVSCDLGDKENAGNDTPDTVQTGNQAENEVGSDGGNTQKDTAEENDIAKANAYLKERGFDGFEFPEDLNATKIEMMDSPATVAGKVKVTFCPVEKDRYEEILTALFSGTGMTALAGTGNAAASPDECLSMLSTEEWIEHRFTFQEPDWNYSVTVVYCPNGGEHGLYGKIEAKTLSIDIQHGTKK